MKKNLFFKLSTLFLFCFSTLLSADEITDKIKAKVQQMMPSLEVSEVTKTPIKGLYGVTIGPRVLYFSEDMRYLVQGSILDAKTMENLTEIAEAKGTIKAIKDMGKDKMIHYSVGAKFDKVPQDTVTVFTDIDCGYCRKLHREMDRYNKLGINIDYLFYPRAGKGSSSYKKAVAVWCATDRKKALTQAKSGQKIALKSCDNPIDEHMKLATLLGVNGTPAMILSSGEMIPGYVPPDKLKLLLIKDKLMKVKSQTEVVKK